MTVDTSALLAIALSEPARSRILDRIETARRRVLSAVSVLEAGVLLRARLGPAFLATGRDFAATDLPVVRL